MRLIQNTTNEYECPNCDNEVYINLAKPDTKVVCLHCKAPLELDVDAEFTNGSWRDLSHLSMAKVN
jgi:hypothetical protein